MVIGILTTLAYRVELVEQQHVRAGAGELENL